MHLSRLCFFIFGIIYISTLVYAPSLRGSDLDMILDENVEASKSTNPQSFKSQDPGASKNSNISDEEKAQNSIESEIEDSSKMTEPAPSKQLENKTEDILTTEQENATSPNQKRSSLQEELKKSTPQQENAVDEQIEELNFGSTPQEPLQAPQNVQKPTNSVSPESSLQTSDLRKEEKKQENELEDSYEEELQQVQEQSPQQDLNSTPQDNVELSEENPKFKTQEENSLDTSLVDNDEANTRIRQKSQPLPGQEEKTYSKEELERLSKETNVDIEDSDYVSGNQMKGRSSFLKSFKERRPTWTQQIEFFYSQFEPTNYTSEIVPTVFDEYYESGDMPLSGLGFDIKRNFSFGAISLGASLGYYSTEAALDDSTLTLIAPSLRLSVFLDTFFEEPYLVPYVTGGYTYFSYLENYSDAVEEIEVSGETDNFYVGFGALFQLDWLDRTADINAYTSGLENTFLFIEARMYLDQGIVRAVEDPDFSTDLFLAAGLRLEF